MRKFWKILESVIEESRVKQNIGDISSAKKESGWKRKI